MSGIFSLLLIEAHADFSFSLLYTLATMIERCAVSRIFLFLRILFRYLFPGYPSFLVHVVPVSIL